MQIPTHVAAIMKRLEQQGYECYTVGGCVRDSLLGLTPHDWDVCTNARPEQVQTVFEDVTCVPTGLRHGTVTVVWEHVPIEITTYRTEGGYSDGRHPDTVNFVGCVEQDLSRRDFTVNAMAYHPVHGLVDPFGGREDLKNSVLRCVGTAAQRFEEDALRILRALRFAACYGFTIELETARALEEYAPHLDCVAAERVRAELDRLLLGRHVGEVLRAHRRVLLPVLPELEAMFDFDQCNPHHHLDVFEHTVKAVECAKEVLTVRLALLLHDIGKPCCFTKDEKGIGHFYGHPSVSESMAESILKRLRYDRATMERVLLLIKYHDPVIEPTEAAVKRWLHRLGEECFRQLLWVKEGDCLGQHPSLAMERLPKLDVIREVLDEVMAGAQCFSLKDLAINGLDVMELGIPRGKAVGEALEKALEAVLEGRIPNDRESLLNALRENT